MTSALLLENIHDTAVERFKEAQVTVERCTGGRECLGDDRVRPWRGGDLHREHGQPGGGDAVTFLFLKPPPPRGVGFQCAATDVYSYAEVRVSATAMTITPKDGAGNLVHDKTGAACGPFRVSK